MAETNRRGLGVFLVAVAVVLAGTSLARGGFYIGKHEGDTLHVMQIVMRMAQGEWPHLDFQTPIGGLAFAPIALMVRAGFGAGHAILAAQALVAAVLLPAIWWVAKTRLRGYWAHAFGAVVLVLVLALVHGETERAVSISMHYNRWAWAVSYLVLAVAVLPPLSGPRKPLIEGGLIGLGLSALALIKATYLVAFLPAVAVALLVRRDWKAIGTVLAAGFAVIVVVTLLAGTPLYWLAYAHDLLIVAGSKVRPQPGLPFGAVVSAPAYMAGSLTALAAVIVLRQAGAKVEGLVLLVLVPGFFYVTYQNFGNDPQWLALLGFILVALRPAPGTKNPLGWDLDKGAVLLATLAFAFATPSALNLAYSPFRHLITKSEEYIPLVPGNPEMADLHVVKSRMHRLDADVALDEGDSPFAAFADPTLREDEHVVWQGEALPTCSVRLGIVTWFEAIAADLNSSGLAQGHTAFTADILSSFWLYGAFDRLPKASPWYYSGLPGFDNADYLLVPLCPLSPKVRKLVLDAVDKSGVKLTEVRRNEMYILYRKSGAASGD